MSNLLYCAEKKLFLSLSQESRTPFCDIVSEVVRVEPPPPPPIFFQTNKIIIQTKVDVNARF